MRFNKNLKALRIVKGITKQQMSQKLGIPYVTYSHYENKGSEPPYNRLKQIAKILGVSVDNLLADDEGVILGELKTNNMYAEEKTRIYTILTQEEIACGLAEEASELAQAALKYRRTLKTSMNVTPVSRQEALDNINEEICDVLMYFIVMGYPIESLLSRAHNNPKWTRWAERLKAGATEVE